jgi:hypothetical protein
MVQELNGHPEEKFRQDAAATVEGLRIEAEVAKDAKLDASSRAKEVEIRVLAEKN